MLLIAILLSFVTRLVLGQTSCGLTQASDSFKQVVMRYTPAVTTQIAPTSTIYETIVTSWYNAVDCRYVTPLRVDENAAVEGPFTTYVRSPTLVVTRVGCMTETDVVTRRDARVENLFELRAEVALQEHKLNKRKSTHQAIEEVIEVSLASFPPDINSLTLQAYRYLVSVNTAIFAINLAQAGIDLNQTCAHLRDPVEQARLFRTTIDPVQAGDIVCFAANNGLYFPVPLSEVVTYLESLIYGILATASDPSHETEYCWPLITESSPFLGVDTDGISQYLCPTGVIPTNSATISTSSPTQSTSTSVHGTGIGTGTGTMGGPPTGGPYANMTKSTPPAGPGYGMNSTFASTTGTAAPYANSTDSASVGASATNSVGTIGVSGTGIVFPNVTYTSVGTGTGAALGTGALTPAPATISPEIESVTSSPTLRVRRW